MPSVSGHSLPDEVLVSVGKVVSFGEQVTSRRSFNGRPCSDGDPHSPLDDGGLTFPCRPEERRGATNRGYDTTSGGIYGVYRRGVSN